VSEGSFSGTVLASGAFSPRTEANLMKSRSQFPWLGACAILAAAPAFAQTPNPARTATPPLDSAPEKIAPGAKPTPNLSDRLSQSNGVIRPQDVDPAIAKPAPKTRDPNVLAPPSPSSQPK
jgi:hypothetical protein